MLLRKFKKNRQYFVSGKVGGSFSVSIQKHYTIPVVRPRRCLKSTQELDKGLQ